MLKKENILAALNLCFTFLFCLNSKIPDAFISAKDSIIATTKILIFANRDWCSVVGLVYYFYYPDSQIKKHIFLIKEKQTISD